jgi:exopolyphosphatase/guanosine-5'-triphosphate,3'-diphosphate pyrophosphatase
MRTAIIDLGTNTFNLLIVDVDGFAYETVFNEKFAVKLGQGGLMDGVIRDDAAQRGMDALAQHMRTIAQYRCQRTLAFATSAVRSASNGYEFVERIRHELGLEVRIISGDEEAQLIFEGVELAMGGFLEPSLIMDIGGGSTEFIIADSTGICWKRSYDLGISRLLEWLQPSDPLTAKDIIRFNQRLDGEITQVADKCREFGVSALIGSSGSFDSFAEMIWASYGLDKSSKEVISEEIDINDLQNLHRALVTSGSAERRAIKGLVEMRVDTIHLASLMVQWILAEAALPKLILSTYALKEGVLQRIIRGTV